MPSRNMLLSMVLSATIYTKLDLRSPYYRLRVAKGNKWKTAFRTPFGTFKHLVMPLGVINVPGVFQRCIDTALRKHIGKYAVTYLGLILVYSDDPANHTGHVRAVLESLQAHALYVDTDQSVFSATLIEYPGKRIAAPFKKELLDYQQAIIKTGSPKDRQQLQELLSGYKHHHDYIKDFRRIGAPLYKLLESSKK